MDTAGRCITDEILTIWEKGRPFSADTLFFLESTLDLATPQAIKAALEEKDFPDRETMMELIFFPGRSLRLALEPLLDADGMTPAAIKEIIHHLIACNASLRLFHPDAAEPMAVRAEPDMIESFISRLFLDRPIPRPVCHALETCHPRSTALECRVAIRTANPCLKKRKTRFLVRFIRKAENISHDVPALFRLMLDNLAETAESADFERSLLEKRRRQETMLKRIRKFEEKRDRYNMEYLMMSKYPVPPESIDSVKETLKNLSVIIDDILSIPPPDAGMPAP